MRSWICGFALLMLWAAPAYPASSPSESVKSAVGLVLSAVRDPQLSNNRSQRRERSESALRDRFDFDDNGVAQTGPDSRHRIKNGSSDSLSNC